MKSYSLDSIIFQSLFYLCFLYRRIIIVLLYYILNNLYIILIIFGEHICDNRTRVGLSEMSSNELATVFKKKERTQLLLFKELISKRGKRTGKKKYLKTMCFYVLKRKKGMQFSHQQSLLKKSFPFQSIARFCWCHRNFEGEISRMTWKIAYGGIVWNHMIVMECGFFCCERVARTWEIKNKRRRDLLLSKWIQITASFCRKQ